MFEEELTFFSRFIFLLACLPLSLPILLTRIYAPVKFNSQPEHELDGV